jgi:hypothetical protein
MDNKVSKDNRASNLADSNLADNNKAVGSLAADSRRTTAVALPVMSMTPGRAEDQWEVAIASSKARSASD